MNLSQLEKKYPGVEVYLKFDNKKGWIGVAEGPLGKVHFLMPSMHSEKTMDLLCQIVSMDNVDSKSKNI